MTKNYNQILEEADKTYWNGEEPKLSDEAYDYITNLTSKEDNVVYGMDLNKNKFIHKTPMLSLDKIYSIDELKTWCQKVSRNDQERFIIQPKYDGIASKIYKQEKKIVTRGKHGISGEDISLHKDIILYLSGNKYYDDFNEFISNINLKSNEIIGEIVIQKSIFINNKDKVLRKTKDQFKTPLNMCGGILSRDYVDENTKNIPVFAEYNNFNTEFNLQGMSDINFDNDINNLIDYIKNEFDFPTDGIVIKLKDENYSKSLGFTSHHPKGQIALKYTNSISKSILNDIEWSLGKNVITPVGIIEPVEISGVTVTRMSLHNYKHIIDNDIQIGDEVIVERAGNIIPQYITTLTKGEKRYIKLIKNCPVCNSELAYEDPFLKCLNENCSGSLCNIIHDAIVKLDIKNIGKSTVSKMIDDLNVKSIIDVLRLTKEDIIKLDGFAEKSSDNAYNEIQMIINNPIEDWRILAALNINGIGRTVSKDILKVKTLDELLVNFTDLISIDGIGQERSKDIIEYFKNKMEFVLEFKSLFKTIISTKQSNDRKEINYGICFTGKAEYKRSYYNEKALELSLIPEEDITNNTKILVTTDLNSSSGKMKQAKKKGIKIISYDEFMNVYNKNKKEIIKPLFK